MFRELERKNKQITSEECIEILKNEKRGVLSVIGDDDYPYGMPMNHFYNEDDGCIYFHSGNIGHRLDSLRKNNKVSFCVYDEGTKKEGHWELHFKSVIIFGRMEIIDDMDTIVSIVTDLSHKFTADDEYIAREIKGHAHRTLILKLTPENICGKKVTES
ncbi:MAG: pyridoxamine 5'-phosphate oxidase family protein [Eubacteriaceae bacterium]|nr:pyridoxamine 5'-phosphate oxidase family protein [Eubacteriaceae bacterium]